VSCNPGGQPRSEGQADEDSDELFGVDASALAETHHGDSHYRWLTLSQDNDAGALRRVLGASWNAAGRSRQALKRGLEHERWGQHVGALAHLLTLGFFRQLGLEVESEPHLEGRSPDLRIAQAGQRALVEIRSLAGFGRRPWEDPGATALRRVPQPEGGAAGAGQVGQQPISRRHERDRARRRARDRAEAMAALDRSLSSSVARALRAKADAYRQLCTHTDLPYVVCLYQDTDTQIAELVLDWGFGSPARNGRRDARGGALFCDKLELAHLSAVLVLGRIETGTGQVALRGELILNPFADRSLPDALRAGRLRLFHLNDTGGVPCWDRGEAPIIEL